MRDNVQSYINDQESSGEINDVAVYFRDLNNGPWFGLNEKMNFSPASLLKVPLMLALYKQALLQPGFINKEVVVVDDGFDNIETIKSEHHLKKGDKKTVGEAIEYMIKYSDNNAAYLLSKTVDKQVFEDTYNELGIGLPLDINYTISVRTYASFFRILYNTTYLGQTYSEEALRLLSESEFKDGLVAGVPGNIKVSHKFGEREFENNIQQIHDCGIIYDDDHTYLLCVMSRGKDSGSLIKTIAQISKIVYDGINK